MGGSALSRAAVFLVSALFFALSSELFRYVLPLFLFFLPGYALIAALKVKFPPLELLCFSVLSSILLSAYSIYFISLFLGYSWLSVYIFSLSILLAAILFPAPLSDLYPSRGDLLPLCLGCFSMLVFGGILCATLWVPSPNGLVVGGWNYGDFFRHISIIRSVNFGNFPPQEPEYAGERIIYHWFMDLHTAIFSRFCGISDITASIMDSTICVGLLSLLTYLLSLHFYKKRSSAAIAVLLVIFGGGFGYMKLSDDLNKNPLPDLLKSNAYDNDWTYYQIPSMLPGFLLPQRAQAIGMPVFAAALLLVVTGYPKDRRRMALLGIIMGLSPLFNYYAFFASFVVVLLYVLFAAGRRLSSFRLKDSLIILTPCIILSAPFFFSAFSASKGMFQWNYGWLAPKNSIVSFLCFYAANLGLASVLAVFALFIPKIKDKWFLAAATLAIFIIPNLFTFSDPSWGMVKFFMFMLLPVSIFAGIVFSKMPQYIWPLILLLCCASPILSSVFYVTCGWIGLTNQEVAAGEWITENTPPGSVFASSTAHNLPVDSVAGRLRILGYEGVVMNYGMDYQSRKKDLRMLYCGPAENVPALLKKYNASYVYYSLKEKSEYGCVPSFAVNPSLVKEYSMDGIDIYRLNNL